MRLTCVCVWWSAPPHTVWPDYLLSNNYVNQIICHKFDFSDEEILAYYISFLKTLSLKLNKNTIHFFYNEVRVGRPDARGRVGKWREHGRGARVRAGRPDARGRTS